jgi:hypothetical protein
MDDLADTTEELVEYLNFYIDASKHATDPEEIAGAADSVCAYYQAVGICELLLDAEVEEFFHHMIRSGRTRKWLLERARGWKDFRNKVLKPSNLRGFFGAVLALDWQLAKEIAELSGKEWDERVEYEDDFHYAQFLHRLAIDGAKAELARILNAYASALDGDEPARFRLCRGLMVEDRDSTLAAFEDLLEDRRKELKTMSDTSILATDGLFVPFSSVYVEGLAWLRLIERARMKTLTDYVYCPSLARAPSLAPFKPTTFPD